MRWRVRAEFRSAFEATVLPHLGNLGGVAGATRVKHNMVRTVWRLPLPDGAVYVKLYRSRTRADRLKGFLRGSKGAIELRAAEKIRRRNLATIEPLALGERRQGPWVDECVLIAREVPHEMALGPYLESLRESDLTDDEAQRIRQRLIVILGHYVWRLHRSGIRHGDFHGGNILVTNLEGGRPFLTLIDLQAASVKFRLTPRYRVRNLATLLHSLRLGLSQTDRLRLLRAYADAAGFSRQQREVWNRRVLRAFYRVHRRNMNSRGKRALRVSTMFDNRRTRDENLFWRRSFAVEEIRSLLAAHAETVRTGTGVFLKQSRRVRVTLQHGGANGEKHRFAVKELFDSGLWTRVKNTLFGSRGRKAWHAGHAFAVRGLATPLSVALHERKRGGLVAQSTVVTAYLDAMVDVKQRFFEQWGSKGILSRREIREKRAFLQVVAREVRRLHDQELYHSDLSGKNLFVSTDRAVPETVYFLDLESVRMHHRVTRARKAKNLSQVIDSLVGAHRTDARRLLRYYAVGTDLDTRSFFAAVERAVADRRRRRAARQSAREAGKR